MIASLPAKEKDTLLTRVAAAEGAQVQALLLRRFRAVSSSPSAVPARTAAELWQAAGDRKAARAKAAEQHQREAEARRTAAQAAAYLAVSLLRDLQALAERQEGSAAFRKRFGQCGPSTSARPACWIGLTRRACPADQSRLRGPGPPAGLEAQAKPVLGRFTPASTASTG